MTRTSTVDAPPLPPEPDFRGGNDWVILTTARNNILAHLIAGRLTEEGIECRLQEHNPTPAAWLFPFGDPNAPVQLYVRRQDLELGRSLLIEASLETEPTGAKTPLSVWLYLATASIVALLLLILEIFDFAPCRLAVFCL